MKTGFASGNGKALQIGWKRRKNISPIYIQIDGLLSIKLDITLPGYPESSSDKNSEIGSRSHLI